MMDYLLATIFGAVVGFLYIAIFRGKRLFENLRRFGVIKERSGATK